MTDPKIQFIDADEIAQALDVGKPALIVLLIQRDHIERQMPQSTLDRLLRLSNTEAHFLAAAGQCEIMVEGYDHDPRELHEVPEVRRFFAHLSERWPYWWHFLGDDARLLFHFLSLEMSPIDTPEGRAYRLPPLGAMQSYLDRMMRGTYALYARHRQSLLVAQQQIDRIVAELTV